MKQLHPDSISGTSSATGAPTTLLFPMHKDHYQSEQCNVFTSTHCLPAPRCSQGHGGAAWTKSCVSYCFVGSNPRSEISIFSLLTLDLPWVQTQSESCSSLVACTALCLYPLPPCNKQPPTLHLIKPFLNNWWKLHERRRKENRIGHSSEFWMGVVEPFSSKVIALISPYT